MQGKISEIRKVMYKKESLSKLNVYKIIKILKNYIYIVFIK